MKQLHKNSLRYLALSGLVGLVLAPGILQASEGKEILLSRCTTCHSAKRIDRASHDRAGWEKTVHRMMKKRGFGPELSNEESEALLDVLVENTK